MSSPKSLPSMVLIEQRSSLTDDPSLLTELLPLFPEPTTGTFGFSEIESDNSLEAITKGKRVNKYKRIMEQTRAQHSGQNRSSAKKSSYVRQPGRSAKSKKHQHPDTKRNKSSTPRKNGSSTTKLAEQYAPFRKFEEKRQSQQQQNREHCNSRSGPTYYKNEKELIESLKEKRTKSILNAPPMPQEIRIDRIIGEYNKNDAYDGRYNKYKETLSQHRRKLHFDDVEPEMQSNSSHARLMSDSQDNSTHYFSASSRSGKFSKASNKSNGTKLTSIASSLKTGASPSEVLAFGAVMEHLTKGGSLRSAKKVFQKEVHNLDKYKSVDSYTPKGKKLGKRGRLLKEETPHDEPSIELSLDNITLLEELTLDDKVYDSDEIKSPKKEDDSVSTFKCDKYTTKNTRGEDDEGDWCVKFAKVPKKDKVGGTADAGEKPGTKGLAILKDEGSVGSETNFDETFYETSFGSGSETESYSCESDAEDTYTYTAGDDTATYDTYSSSYSDMNHHRRNEVPQKKNFFHMLKGKKQTKKRSSDNQKLLQVDRLPDSFDDENVENTNTGNNSKRSRGFKGKNELSKQKKRNEKIEGTSKSKNNGVTWKIGITNLEDIGKSQVNSQNIDSSEVVSKTNEAEESLVSYVSENDEDTICGGSITMESIASLDETIESLMGGLDNVVQFATDSMRSARSLLFPDEDNDYQGMSAAAEFEAEIKAIEGSEGDALASQSAQPENSPISQPKPCEKEELVLEGPKCEETAEKMDEKALSSETTGNMSVQRITSVAVSKKPKLFRKKMSFLKSKKQETQLTSHESDLCIDENESYEVLIDVYNREAENIEKDNDENDGCDEKTNENISTEMLLDPKPLMDIDEEEPENERTASDGKKPSIVFETPTQTEKIMTDLLMTGQICCGKVAVNQKLIASSLQNQLEAARGKMVVSCEKLQEQRNPGCDTEGLIVRTFEKRDTVIRSMPTDERENKRRNPTHQLSPINRDYNSYKKKKNRNLRYPIASRKKRSQASF